MANKVKLAPNIFSYPDFEHSDLYIEISLGGVKKDITLKVHDESVYIHTPQDDFEYLTAMGFCCPVKASKDGATFENGILKVVITFKDRMEDPVQINID